MYRPATFTLRIDNLIGPMGGIGTGMINMGLAAPATAAWPTANKAIYIPFTIERQVTVFQVGWHNGTSPAGTREVGVYRGNTKLISGAATGTTASVVQLVNVTDTVLTPGQYWLAATDTGVTHWHAWAPVVPCATAMGILTQTSANPLPATKTPALDHALAYIPFAFLVCRSTV